MSNKDKGYISLYRSIQDHKLYPHNRAFTLFEAWVDLLMKANHKDVEMIVEMSIKTINRGDILTSEVKLSGMWRWSRTKVRDFLRLLESDEMIIKKSTSKYTIITICNYDNYQCVETSEKHQKNIKKTSEKHQKNTNNNDNNDNNNTNTWRTDFLIYQKECNAGYNKCWNDDEWWKKTEELYPSYNLERTIKKSHAYWSSEEGWRKKKASKTKEIDWKATIIKSLDISRSYYTREEEEERKRNG